MRALRVLAEVREALATRVEDEVAVALGPSPTPEALARAAARAHAAMDQEGRRVLARAGALAPACAAGCSYCCHVHVDATAPEILAVAAHLARAFREEEITALRARLAAQVRRVEGLSDEARWAAKVPCALLDEGGRCSIYEARPLRCRAFHSCDAAPCREAFAGAPDRAPVENPQLRRAHDAAEEGYDRALARAGLSAAGYRLEAGLLLALEAEAAGEEAGARWLAGEPVFDREVTNQGMVSGGTSSMMSGSLAPSPPDIFHGSGEGTSGR